MTEKQIDPRILSEEQLQEIGKQNVTHEAQANLQDNIFFERSTQYVESLLGMVRAQQEQIAEWERRWDGIKLVLTDFMDQYSEATKQAEADGDKLGIVVYPQLSCAYRSGLGYMGYLERGGIYPPARKEDETNE